jgi:hypothetical protein
MKTNRILHIIIIAAVTAISAIGLSGCQTTSLGEPGPSGHAAAAARAYAAKSLPYLQVAAKNACTFALMAVPAGGEREAVRADIHRISTVVAALAGNSTPAELTAAIERITPASSEYPFLIAMVTDLYSTAYDKLKGDALLLAQVTARLAAGCAEATRLPAAGG